MKKKLSAIGQRDQAHLALGRVGAMKSEVWFLENMILPPLRCSLMEVEDRIKQGKQAIAAEQAQYKE